jgi:hypothetical protein
MQKKLAHAFLGLPFDYDELSRPSLVSVLINANKFQQHFEFLPTEAMMC